MFWLITSVPIISREPLLVLPKSFFTSRNIIHTLSSGVGVGKHTMLKNVALIFLTINVLYLMYSRTEKKHQYIKIQTIVLIIVLCFFFGLEILAVVTKRSIYPMNVELAPFRD